MNKKNLKSVNGNNTLNKKVQKNLKFLFDHQLPIEHVRQQLVFTNISMDLSDFIIYI